MGPPQGTSSTIDQAADPRPPGQAQSRWFALVLAVGAGARLALLALPKAFVTDVAYYNAQAVRYILGGADPYGAAYSVPAHLATPGAANVFAYLPGVFAFIVPAGLAWEAALGLVASDMVVAWALHALGKRGWVWSSLYLLFPPAVLFSTYFPNDSLPAVAFLCAALALESRGDHRAGSLLWGLAFASSQEAWLVFPFYLAYSLRRRDFASPFVAVATAGAVIAPFLAWNPAAFFHDTVLFQFQRQASAFLSSGPFGLNVNPSLQGILASLGASAPVVVRGALAAAVLALVLWRFRDGVAGLALGGAVFTAAGLFLLAGDLFWAYLELPLVLTLAWAAVRGWPRGFNAYRDHMATKARRR